MAPPLQPCWSWCSVVVLVVGGGSGKSSRFSLVDSILFVLLLALLS